MGFWLATGGFLLAVAVGAWIIPTRLGVRWLLPPAALVVGILLLTPRRTVLLPMIFCSNDTDCRMVDTTHRTLVGLSVPAGDRLGYEGRLVLALVVALGAAVLSLALILYRARPGLGGH